MTKIHVHKETIVDPKNYFKSTRIAHCGFKEYANLNMASLLYDPDADEKIAFGHEISNCEECIDLYALSLLEDLDE